MNDLPRRKLIEIIAKYGTSVIDEPHRVEGLLRDFCGEYKREIHALMDASRERIPLSLRAPPSGLPPVILIPNLTKRLLDNRPMAEDMAHWAVESWAIALGVISGPTAPKPISAPPVQATPRPISTPPVPVQPAYRATPPTPAFVTPRLTFEPQMVQIPAGEFLMGSTPEQVATVGDWAKREQPQHRVMLAEYAIGKYPITCREYQAFAQDSGQPAPRGWSGNQYPAGKAEHPVVNVSWEDAQAYCAWLSQKTGKRYRLPSEAEWEKAARGTDGRIYPWGNRFETGRANSSEAKLNGTTPVGQFSPQGDSPYGCVDMAGNVWEWVNDWYAEDYYRSSPGNNPPGPTKGQYKVLRGGGWYDYLDDLRVADRGSAGVVARGSTLGFRCAATPGH